VPAGQWLLALVLPLSLNLVPLLLGQVNFFMGFNVCFFRARSLFEIRPKQTTS
jgi:hypothetical protein